MRDLSVQQQAREGSVVQGEHALHGLAQVHQDLVRPLACCGCWSLGGSGCCCGLKQNCCFSLGA